MEALWNFEIAITLFFQSLGAWLVEPMRWITSMGSESFYMLIMPAVYWCFDSALGLRMGLILMVSTAFNADFKLLSHGARPYWFDARVQAFSTETSFGMPSGHAMLSSSTWGMIAAQVRRKWVTWIILVLIFLIGISRIYLGVHFTSDVLAGWILGGLMLLIFIKLDKPITHWLQSRSSGMIILVGFLVSLALLGIHLALAAAGSQWMMPAEWVKNALAANPDVSPNPFSVEGAFTTAGTLFGLIAGAAWLFRSSGFDTSGTIEQRGLRYLIGLVGVAVLWYGLGLVFPRDATLIAYGLRFCRYTLIGLWVSGLAPMLFIRLGLAKGSEKALVK